MIIENTIHPLAMVTSHLVEEVACSEPERFLEPNGEVRVYKVLEYLGFKVKHNLYNKDIVVLKDILVRTRDKPYLVYHADVYKGHIRKEKAGHNGAKTLWRFHPLYDEYDKRGVLQPNDLSKYVDDTEFEEITDIGFY